MQDSYSFLFDEGSPAGSVVGTVVAIDMDSEPNRISVIQSIDGDTSLFNIVQVTTPGDGPVLTAEIRSSQVCVVVQYVCGVISQCVCVSACVCVRVYACVWFVRS